MAKNNNKQKIKCCLVCMLSILWLCLFSAQAQRNVEEDYKSFIKSDIKEADAIVRLKMLNYFEDGCKECVSEGRLYMIKAIVSKTYFNKAQKKNSPITHIKDTFTFMSVTDSNFLSTLSDSVIVFLEFHNPNGKRFYMQPKTPNVFWYAHIYTFVTTNNKNYYTKMEKLIIDKTKKSTSNLKI